MNKLFLAAFVALSPTIALAQPPLESFWDHNGSLMRTVDDGFRVAVYYQTVRSSLRATTPPGAIAFDGTRVNGNGIVGNAFVYTKYCPGRPFPYRVTGYINGTIDVRGAAAVVDPNSCRIVDYRWDSDNAHRVFQAVVVALPPPPPPLPPVVVVPQPQPQQPPIIVTPSCTGICAPIQIVPDKPNPRKLSPDEEAEDLENKGREFCRRNPHHAKCNNQVPTERNIPPMPATPLDK